MTTQTQAIAAGIAQSLAAAAPVLAAGAGAATIVALAPIALQFLDAATKLQQAGAMTPDQLAALFAGVGQGIQSTHDRWTAMNEADAKA